MGLNVMEEAAPLLVLARSGSAGCSASMRRSAARASKRSGHLAGRFLVAERIDMQGIDVGYSSQLRRKLGCQRHSSAHADLPVRSVRDFATRKSSRLVCHPLAAKKGDPR